MRTAISVALVLVLVGVVALCPALACFTPVASHPCCPAHPAPAAVQHCPSLVLETGKTAPLISTAMAGPVPAGWQPPLIAALPISTDGRSADSQDLLLFLRVLRI
ncbi:MAG TPA: hypothetical protein VKX45_02035 [Bryobacteraceae bacterium]|jgi:hypothetical protein|nr:hypothetical protein [Bryobacteraceae bacterium]